MCNSMVGVGYLENWRHRDTSEDNLSRKDIELIVIFQPSFDIFVSFPPLLSKFHPFVLAAPRTNLLNDP